MFRSTARLWASLCLLALAVLLSATAHADSLYKVTTVDSGPFNLVEANDYGDYVLDEHTRLGLGPCQYPAFYACYATYYADSGVTVFSNTVPDLPSAPVTNPGTGCNIDLTNYGATNTETYCNNGHEIVVSQYDQYGNERRGIYDGPDPLTDLVSGGLVIYSPILTANGEFWWQDPSIGGDYIRKAVPVGFVAAPTPEPTSFTLMATGLLAGVGVIRRRLRA